MSDTKRIDWGKYKKWYSENNPNGHFHYARSVIIPAKPVVLSDKEYFIVQIGGFTAQIPSEFILNTKDN